MTATDAECMGLALQQARQALLAGEVPIGACLVHRERRIVAHNRVLSGNDPTGHAEIVAIRRAGTELNATRLDGARLYVTVEPCLMCAAASHYAGIAEVHYGASLADLQELTGDELSADSLPVGLRLRGGLQRDASLALLLAWSERRALR